MNSKIDNLFDSYKTVLNSYQSQVSINQVGRVLEINENVVLISGLPKVKSDELLIFEDGSQAVVLNLNKKSIGAILLTTSDTLVAGMSVVGTGRRMDTPVGEELLGRVIDATGKALDNKKILKHLKRMPIESLAPPILARSAVSRSLQTGIKVIDSFIPIGRGQRQLILGDRQIGKTAIAVDIICQQKDVICIYCAIGQKAGSVISVINQLKESNAIKHTVVVVASPNLSPGLQYITPFAATTMAEYFMNMGKDVLIVYDDLTRHAQSYRELSLLLQRPPGREAYPGDIFYLHARLLERSTQLKEGGSLSALPIIETQAQNISAYIPTNLISITDGQIYLSPALFQKGQFPAIDVGKSVSRVGGKAQPKIYLRLIKELSLSYAQFEELESFSRFNFRLDKQTQKVLKHGEITRAILKQSQGKSLLVAEQAIIFMALNHRLLDVFEVKDIPFIENYLIDKIKKSQSELYDSLNICGDLNDENYKKIIESIKHHLAHVIINHENS